MCDQLAYAHMWNVDADAVTHHHHHHKCVTMHIGDLKYFVRIEQKKAIYWSLHIDNDVHEDQLVWCVMSSHHRHRSILVHHIMCFLIRDAHIQIKCAKILGIPLFNVIKSPCNQIRLNARERKQRFVVVGFFLFVAFIIAVARFVFVLNLTVLCILKRLIDFYNT